MDQISSRTTILGTRHTQACEKVGTETVGATVPRPASSLAHPSSDWSGYFTLVNG